MLSIEFRITDEQFRIIQKRCKEIDCNIRDKLHLYNFMSNGHLPDKDMGREGGTYINTPKGSVWLSLADVTPIAIEPIYGDDPALTREENRAELREYIVSEMAREHITSETWNEFETPQAKRDHFAMLLGILDNVGDTRGHQPVRYYETPAKTKHIQDTDRVVSGDTLRLQLPVTDNRHTDDDASKHSRIVVGDVVDTSGNFYKMVITKSFGFDAYRAGSIVYLDKEHVMKHLMGRSVWKNEADRDKLLKIAADRKSTRARKAATGHGNDGQTLGQST